MLDTEGLKRLNRLIGDRMRQLRESQRPKMSQIQLAEILGLKRTSVTNIEMGKQKPTIDALYKLCDHFGMPIGDFLPPVVDVALAPSQSVIVGKRTVEVGSKTASFLESLRGKKPVRPVGSTPPEEN